MWKDSYLNDLNIIIETVNAGDIALVKKQFAEYIVTLRSIDFYDKNNWRRSGCRVIFPFLGGVSLILLLFCN